jgi:hypothetical protein
MRRYLAVALLAEVLGIIALWMCVDLFDLGPHQRGFGLTGSRIYDEVPFQVAIKSRGDTSYYIHQYGEVYDRALGLAKQLDLLDGLLPFVFGFPAIAVLGLWTIDRRRKHKMRLEQLHETRG